MERHKFAQGVLRFINPKFDSDVELDIVLGILLDFSAKCELTGREFMLALELSADGKLFLEDSQGNSSPVKLYREIDRIKLGEIQQAYIQYRNSNKQFEDGMSKVKAFINPPVEETPEQKRKIRIEFLTHQYNELQNNGSVTASVVFYSALRKVHKVVNLDFVDYFLSNFKPEKYEKQSLGFKMVKQDAHTYFKDKFVDSAIKKYKLNEKTLEQWIEFWDNTYNKKE